MKNLYAASELDQRPSFFVRLLILRWLDERSNTFGPKRLKGYAHVGEMRNELSRYGVEPGVFTRALEGLARGFCVYSEDFRTTELTDEDLVALAPAGRVHLQVCSDVFYLAAIAEDTWFDVEAIAASIAERIKDPVEHFSLRTILYNAEAAVETLTVQRQKELDAYSTMFDDQRLIDLTSNVEKAKRSVDGYRHSLISGPWTTAGARYPVGSVHEGIIVNKKVYGLFVDVEPGITGLVHSSQLGDGKVDLSLKRGTKVRVQVLEVDYFQHRMSLKLVLTQ